MTLEEMRLAIIAMVFEANKAQNGWSYSISISKSEEYVHASYVEDSSVDYEIFCYSDRDKGPHYHDESHSNFKDRTYMTSQEVFEKLKAHIDNAVKG